jgi:hypothetical protein
LAFETRKTETLNEVLRINSDGSVGIGEVNPQKLLQLSGNDPDLRQNILSTSSANLVEHEFTVDNVVQSALYFSKADDSFYLRNKTAGALHLGTDNSNDISIETGGDVTIASLTGSGTRMVTVNGVGKLDEQSIPVNTDGQTLSFVSNNLTISNGNTVNLSALQDGTGTDNQTLSFDSNNNTLSISGSGNSVDLSSINESPWVQNNSNLISYGGNVGIGTSNPRALLDVEGRTRVGWRGYYNQIWIPATDIKPSKSTSDWEIEDGGNSIKFTDGSDGYFSSVIPVGYEATLVSIHFDGNPCDLVHASLNSAKFGVSEIELNGIYPNGFDDVPLSFNLDVEGGEGRYITIRLENYSGNQFIFSGAYLYLEKCNSGCGLAP